MSSCSIARTPTVGSRNSDWSRVERQVYHCVQCDPYVSWVPGAKLCVMSNASAALI